MEQKGYWVLQYWRKPFISDQMIWYSRRREDLPDPAMLARMTGLDTNGFSTAFYGKDDFHDAFKDYLRVSAD